MIRLDQVQKNYSSSQQIGPLTFDIPDFGLTSIIGPNGAGKSTLLMMMGRLLDKDGGQIYYADQDMDLMASNDLAKQVAILQQENHIVSRVTVRQLVAFGRFPHSQGRLTCVDEAIISKYLEFFDLVDLQDAYLDHLSGGQRQRAYVAMVLCQETPYILLDEPLNNLDITHSVQMMDHLKTACKELDRTIIVVLHDINFAAKYSDHICVMKNGQVQAFGPTASIMDEALLSEIFCLDISILDGPDGMIAYF